LQFEGLDLNLQESFEAFIRERGVDEQLAAFVPEYAQWKEQRVRCYLPAALSRC
jgi:complement component 1 Q subcomponent-binding protein